MSTLFRDIYIYIYIYIYILCVCWSVCWGVQSCVSVDLGLLGSHMRGSRHITGLYHLQKISNHSPSGTLSHSRGPELMCLYVFRVCKPVCYLCSQLCGTALLNQGTVSQKRPYYLSFPY